MKKKAWKSSEKKNRRRTQNICIKSEINREKIIKETSMNKKKREMTLNKLKYYRLYKGNSEN